MLELTGILILISILFLGIAWIDKKNKGKNFYIINFGIVLIILFFLTFACLVERVVNHLILKIC